MTQRGGPPHFARDTTSDSGVISRRIQSTHPASSRTKPLFRRSEGSRAQSPAVVAIRARSPLASLRAGSRPAGRNAAVGMTPQGGPPHFAQDITSDSAVISRRTQSRIRRHPERSRFSGGVRDLARSPRRLASRHREIRKDSPAHVNEVKFRLALACPRCYSSSSRSRDRSQ
jgi:hypothetical protein